MYCNVKSLIMPLVDSAVLLTGDWTTRLITFSRFSTAVTRPLAAQRLHTRTSVTRSMLLSVPATSTGPFPSALPSTTLTPTRPRQMGTTYMVCRIYCSTGFPCLLESPGFLSLTFKDFPSLWSWKVLEKLFPPDVIF